MLRHEVFTKLRNVLAELYPDEAGSRTVVAAAGVTLGLIQFSTRALDNWREILDRAEQSGLILALLDEADKAFSENQALQAARDAYQQWMADGRPSGGMAYPQEREAATFDIVFRYWPSNVQWLESIAYLLLSKHGIRAGLDCSEPNSQPETKPRMAQARTWAICIGSNTPKPWFRSEILRALDYQRNTGDLRIIPVLLPDASDELIDEFSELRIWADFRDGHDEEYALHVLLQGIRGLPLGRWPPPEEANSGTLYRRKLREVTELYADGLLDYEVVKYAQRKIVAKLLEERR
jgi:hypothetical protein